MSGTNQQDGTSGTPAAAGPRLPARDHPDGQPTDADLLRAHVDGDPAAFGELFARHKDRCWAVAVRLLGDPDEAADAVQDAMLSAFRRADSFRGDSAVTTWLHRIVVNACLDQIRRRSSRPVALGGGELLDNLEPRQVVPAGSAGSSDTRLDVMRALATLVPGQRAALVLVDMLGYSVSDAAQMLGVSEGTIKSRCARGRARLLPRLAHLRSARGETAEHRNRDRDPRVLPAQQGGEDAP